jgi:hypothetical protein
VCLRAVRLEFRLQAGWRVLRRSRHLFRSLRISEVGRTVLTRVNAELQTGLPHISMIGSGAGSDRGSCVPERPGASGDARPARRSLTQEARPATLKAVWRDLIGERRMIPPVTVTRGPSEAIEILPATGLEADQEVKTHG